MYFNDLMADYAGEKGRLEGRERGGEEIWATAVGNYPDSPNHVNHGSTNA